MYKCNKSSQEQVEGLTPAGLFIYGFLRIESVCSRKEDFTEFIHTAYQPGFDLACCLIVAIVCCHFLCSLITGLNHSMAQKWSTPFQAFHALHYAVQVTQKCHTNASMEVSCECCLAEKAMFILELMRFTIILLLRLPTRSGN